MYHVMLNVCEDFIVVILYRPSSASSEHSHCSSNMSGSRLSNRKSSGKKNRSSERKVYNLFMRVTTLHGWYRRKQLNITKYWHNVTMTHFIIQVSF